ncbi:MAG: alpha/beta fold hydrolase [Acidobacteriota bacterium]|nr:alpha/beta fold hydrolase [Acidobacteriota bacterium]
MRDGAARPRGARRLGAAHREKEAGMAPHAAGKLAAGAVAAGAVLLAVVPGVATAGDGPGQYPVPWTFAAAVPAGMQDGPDVPPPGSHDAGQPCSSAAHPEPVVLVHGLAADQSENWQTIAPFLSDNGYCVYSLTYGNNASAPRPFDQVGGLADMTRSAQVLAAFVQQVLAVTHAAKVDVVGHSEGGTMPDWYLKFDGGSRYVDHFVALSGVLHGTQFWGAGAAYALGQAYGSPGSAPQIAALLTTGCTSCDEFLPTSPWMKALDDPGTSGPASAPATVCPYDGASVEGVSYTSIATTNDELVRPPTSDFIDPRCANAHNILVQDQCAADQADHISIAADPVAAQDILNALDPQTARPVICYPVLPAVG